MSSNITLPVGSEQEGQRIDKFLQESLPGMSRSQAQKWIVQGLVRIGEKAAGKNDKLKSGMVVSVELPIPPEELDGEPDWEEILHPTTLPQPQEIPLDIVYEDEYLLVVNKPKHMVVHPGAGNEQGTLVNALLFHCKGKLASCNGMERQGIVHRIDKDTSGLLVCAKDDESYRALSEQIAAHTVDRFYEAVVYGNVKEDSGTIDLPIGRSLKDRKKMAVRLDTRQPDGSLQGAREAVTHFEVLRRYEGFTHLRCRLETGRTHQIRVHLSYLGYPVAGDELYGPQKAIKRLQGQCLHARALGFTHPVTGERLYFESQLPEYFTSFLKTLRPKEDLSNGERTDF
jgi:23S rRNA pseudouridine1911/1915/1917 synthase